MFKNRHDKNFYSAYNVGPDSLGGLLEINDALGSHLIRDDTTVIDGVYIPTETSDWRTVKVDYAENHEVYDRLLGKARAEATTESGHLKRCELPKAIYKTVRREMNSPIKKVLGKKQPEFDWENIDAGSKDGWMVNLSDYVKLGKGESHHQALIAAALLEKLIDEETLHGNVRVETGTRFNQNDVDDHEVHAWVRYTKPGGRALILDPKKGYFGKLEDSLTKVSWDYFHYGEREEYEARRHRRLGIAVMKGYRNGDEGHGRASKRSTA